MALDFPDPYPMERWSEGQWMRFHPICDGLEAHGYWISTTPLVGQFDEWLADKRKALKLVEKKAAEIRGARRLARWVLGGLDVKQLSPDHGARWAGRGRAMWHDTAIRRSP